MKIYAIAVYDNEESELKHEVVKAEDEYNAFKIFETFWDLIVALASDDHLDVPEDLKALEEFCDSYSIEVSIIEVQ